MAQLPGNSLDSWAAQLPKNPSNSWPGDKHYCHLGSSSLIKKLLEAGKTVILVEIDEDDPLT
ncbi:unnamed protein product [Prunus armeniaca]|uniref:Uncharacterized protein n=1 Tax=Prunus armeniaca TaxID=36596 RepID=A0A6J5UPI6_PRUAR|nr:unnamed protein product [Prunus armeniaca]